MHPLRKPARIVLVALGAAALTGGPLGDLAADPPDTLASPSGSRGEDLRPLAEALRERPNLPPAVLFAPLPEAPPVRVERGPFTSVQVNVGRHGNNILGDAANEPSIAVDPTDPNRMAIGWRQFDAIESDFRQAGAAFSTDGGRTWQNVTPLDPGVFRSDPVLTSGPTGQFNFSSLRADAGYWVEVYTSSNQGASWGIPVYAYGGDKQWIVTDRTTSTGRGQIYQAWNERYSCCGNGNFTRSTNGGMSFSSPVKVAGNPIWGTMDVAPDGTLYLAGVNPSNSTQIVVGASITMREAAYLPYFETVRSLSLGGQVRAGVGSSPNPAGLLGQVWVVAEPTAGPRAGWVYVLCSVDPPDGDPMDVMFARSTDGGDTWSAPVRVNVVRDGWQWFGTMSIAPDGRLDVVWVDTQASGDMTLGELTYAMSRDGGVTWSENVPLGPAWNSTLGWPVQMKIGDYYHMVSDVVGANLAYAATYNGEEDVWFLRIGDYDCNANGIGDALDVAQHTSTDWNENGIPDECEGLELSDSEPPPPAAAALFQNAPNPCNPSTVIHFDLPSASAVRLRLYDVAGRMIATLDREARAGRNAVVWDGTDDAGRPVNTGIYVYRLEAPGFTAARRLAVVR